MSLNHDPDSSMAAVHSLRVVVGAAVGSIAGGLTANGLAAFGGFLIALLGFALQAYFNLRDEKRKAEKHEEWKKKYKYGEINDDSEQE